jgi:LuxR family transcriptional regulator, maltose regulon positive regulatory protein
MANASATFHAGERPAPLRRPTGCCEAGERRRRPPPLRHGTVQRERLLRRLAQTADVPLSLLVAPAGYGKTTLLAHWVARDRRAVAWLSLGDCHDDPARLATDIALALHGCASNGRLRLLPARGADAAPGDLLRSMDGMDGPFVLVLDDLHRISSPDSLDVVRTIADALPPQSQLVLASRAEPALPIAMLRAQGRLVDLRSRDLAMTRRETAAMLQLAGVDVGPDDVLALLGRTEGWPAGLYLAATAMRERRDAAALSGDDRVIADYLRDEILAALDADTLTFLRRTSVLDRLSGPVCDAVLGRRGCGAVLRELSRGNVLMARLDGSDGSYRYHDLLAQMLRAELRRCEPEVEAELHARASAFYAGAGDVDRAIEHAASSGDIARAGDLLWRSASEHVLNGRNADVRRWLARFSRDQLAAHPTLALTAAASHLVAGERDLVEHWAAAAGRGLGPSPPPELVAAVTMMRAAVARDGIARMGQDAARAYERLPDDSPWRSLCRFLTGVDAHLRGALVSARHDLEEGARRGAITAPAIQVLCLAQLALMALDKGDWEEGPLLAARARAQIERVGLGDHPPCALVFAVSALVRAHRDRVEDAQADRRRASELLTFLVDHVAWYDVETRVVLARAALRLGDVAGTRALLHEATRMLARAQDAVVLKESIEVLRARTGAFAVTEVVEPSSLTTAELRVLGMMPTHQSFREMGIHLSVSANTVKTHAHAVYRKLAVRSRSQAVDRAREIGLLDDVA